MFFPKIRVLQEPRLNSSSTEEATNVVNSAYNVRTSTVHNIVYISIFILFDSKA
jgi:hypothetical protein